MTEFGRCVLVALLASMTSVIVSRRIFKKSDPVPPPQELPKGGGPIPENEKDADNSLIMGHVSETGKPDFSGTSVALNDESRANTIISICSSRGHSHGEQGIPRQDDFSIFDCEQWTVIAIADGVGSARLSHYGSSWLTRKVKSGIDLWVQDFRSHGSWNHFAQRLSKEMIKESALIGYDGHGPIRKLENEEDILRRAGLLSSTLELLLVSKFPKSDKSREFIYVRVAGDGALLKFYNDGSMEFQGQVIDYTESSAVKTLPGFNFSPSISQGSISPNDCLVIMTDGLAEQVSLKGSESERTVSELARGVPRDYLAVAGHLKSLLIDVNDDVTAAFIWLT